MPDQIDRVLALRTKRISTEAIARQLGISRSTVRTYLKRAIQDGRAPGLVQVPVVEGMALTKTTVQYGADGTPLTEWRRLSPDQEMIESAVLALEQRIAGKSPKIPMPKDVAADLLLELPIPDHHFGMLAWAKETRGEDYDCAIARTLLLGAAGSVMSDTVKPGKVVLSFMGDYFHADNRSQSTEKSGHVLDCDSRFGKRVDAAVQTACDLVEMSLRHAGAVDVVIISGNHDWHSMKWMARILSAYFRANPRVKILPVDTPRQYIQHGKVMLCYMHGDTMKASKFAGVIPSEQPKMWADTTFRYGRVGHWHHRSTEEHAGVVIETLPTLAAPDSYASEHGYKSGRAFTAFVWHRKYGLRSKMERSPEEIRDFLKLRN